MMLSPERDIMTPDAPSLLLFSECSMSGRHGTGVQLLRLFDSPGISYNHLYFGRRYAGLSEVRRSYLLENFWPARLRGRRTWEKVLGAIGLGWWRNDIVRERKFRSLMRAKSIHCDLFYAVVSCEEHAKRALSLARLLAQPYIVHVMDIFHVEGIAPDSMPAFRELIAGASHVVVISEAIGEEVRRIRSQNVTCIPMGMPRAVMADAAPGRDGGIRVVLMGRPYEGLELLAQSIPEIMRRWPNLRFVYFGQHGHHLPAALLPVTDLVGYRSDSAEVERKLAANHLAFLCGPRGMDCFGRFSIPSRLGDFLMAGLPVLAATGEQTAARRFLSSVGESCIANVASTEDIVSGIGRFTESQDAWQAASDAARAYAEKHLHIEVVRGKVTAIVRSAVSPAASA